MELLNRKCFKAFLNWKIPEPLDLNREAVCVVQLEQGGFAGSAFYAKFYDTASQPKGLLNEILGYCVAKSWGFDVPEFAAVAFLPLKRLKLTTSPPSAQWLKSLAKKTEVYPAFCTSVVSASPPAITFGLNVDAIRQDVALWKNLPAAVALDHVIANTDRHFGNLLRISKSRYALIDHGRLFNDAAASWTANDLKIDGVYKNRLAELMTGAVENLGSQVCKAAADNAQFSSEGLSSLPDWLVNLTPQNEVNHLRKVVEQRSMRSSTALPREMGHLC